MDLIERMVLAVVFFVFLLVVWVFLNTETLQCIGYCNGSESFVIERR